MTSFSEVEGVWLGRLGTLRNVVRQHVIQRQLVEHIGTTGRALDVGRGQGTQAVELASRGLQVTGLDPSRTLLGELAAAAEEREVSVEVHHGGIEDLDHLLGDRAFDVVCAHGLLMYLPDARSAIATLAARVARGGILSLTFRNGEALAYRPGIRGQWRRALETFDATTYVNELGVDARAHTLDEVSGWCEESGLAVVEWYGVRVLTDGAGRTKCLTQPRSRTASRRKWRPEGGTPTGEWDLNYTSSPERSRHRRAMPRDPHIPDAFDVYTVVVGRLACDVMEWWVRAGSLAFPLTGRRVGDRRSMPDD